MTEISLFWGGTTIGDHGTYTDDQFSDFIRRLFQTDRTTQGVLFGQDNELAITNPSGVTIRVASGLALVDGKLYQSSADVDHTIEAPGAGFNYYTIALRKDFSAQTVRQVLLGPSSVAYPAITQTDGTTWDISIAQVNISDASVVTLVDTREFCHVSSKISSTEIEDWEVASGAEVRLGTDNIKIVTSKSLSDSALVQKTYYLRTLDPDMPLYIGDAVNWIVVPEDFSPSNLVKVGAMLSNLPSSSGVIIIQVSRWRAGTSVDMLTTAITIDEGHYTSYTATTQSVIDPANDDLVTGDRIQVDIGAIGTDAVGLDMIFTTEIQS